MVALGERLRQVRKSHGLTLKQASERSGMSVSHLCGIERGAQRPSEKALQRIAEGYGMTAEALTAGAWRPSPRAERRLRTRGKLLRRLFGYERPRVPESTLAVLCREAGFYSLGKVLVERLRAQQRAAPFWNAARLYLQGQNGAEQMTSLHLFQRAIDLEDLEPQYVRFPRPVVQEPGRRWLAMIIQHKGCTILVYPQVPARGVNGQHPTLDFAVCITDGLRTWYLAVEVDGPGHKGREFKDAERDVNLGLPVLRVPLRELDRDDFVDRLLDRIVESRKA